MRLICHGTLLNHFRRNQMARSGKQAYRFLSVQFYFTCLQYNIKIISVGGDDAHRVLPDLVPDNFTGNASYR